jgi:hypothetical protein
VIRFELGSKRVYRNKSEWHTKPTCRCGDIVVEGYGSLISKLAGILAEKNPQINPLVEVWRGDTLVFTPHHLNHGLRAYQPRAISQNN